MPAKKLQMSCGDLNNILTSSRRVTRSDGTAETIGAYIENSGIDMTWIESDLYGPCTVKQILEGNHVKRAETAHLVTLQSLFVLYQEAFLKEEAGNH